MLSRGSIGLRLLVSLLTVLGAFSLIPINRALSQPATKSRVIYKRTYPNAPFPEASNARWTHAAYKLEACSICHVSKNRAKPGKLRASVNRICTGCHRQIGKLLEMRRVVHRPVADNCTHCHNPHNSPYRLLLHAPPSELCTHCHVGIKALVESATVEHDAVIKGNSCINCHSVHVSPFEHLLADRQADVCLSCHGADSLKDHDGKALTNLDRLLTDNAHKHEPVEKKDCSVCHNAHGSSYYRLLNNGFPEGIYSPYSRNAYALCFNCHDNEESFSKAETTSTGFRDGKTNLHAIHLKRGERGRTCRVCHGEHAAPIEHLIRESVPFGAEGWKLNVNYIPDADGGRCLRSCHETKIYSNGGGLAQHKIAAGRPIPNATLPTLDGGSIPIVSNNASLNMFIFFEPQQERSLTALNMLSRLCSTFANRKVHCTAIVSDLFSKSVVQKSIAKAKWVAAGTAIDKDNSYYLRLGQVLHPSFWIVSNTAVLHTYEPYASGDLFEWLSARVKFALGDITEAQLTKAFSRPKGTKEQLIDRAQLNLAFAKKLIAEKKADKALVHAQRAIDINATFAEAYLFIGVIYSQQGRCELAIPYLNETLRLDKKNKKALQHLASCKK